MGQWELNDGTGQVGPLEEDHVTRMVSAGIPEHTVVRQVGESEWRSLRTHAPFAIALVQRAASAPAGAPPVAAIAPSAQPQRPVTIEQTGKGWKLAQALGVIGCVFGVLGACGGSAAGTGGAVGVGLVVFAGGFVTYLVARFGAWWSTG